MQDRVRKDISERSICYKQLKSNQMKKKSKGSGYQPNRKKGYIDAYNARETKSNPVNTGIKTLVDVILGATIGAGIGSASGKQAKWIGLSMIGIGHFMGDKSGVIRIAGASAIAYGIAKHFENEQLSGTFEGITLAGETGKAQTRLAQFKDELFATFYLDKVFKKNPQLDTLNSASEVGAIDLSSLDIFENFNHQEASDFQENQNQLEDYSINEAPNDFTYAIIEDDVDFSKL